MTIPLWLGGILIAIGSLVALVVSLLVVYALIIGICMLWCYFMEGA